MASNSKSRMEVPEAKAAMDRFKTEVASELGVNLKEGYNGDLTSKEVGSFHERLFLLKIHLFYTLIFVKFNPLNYFSPICTLSLSVKLVIFVLPTVRKHLP